MREDRESLRRSLELLAQHSGTVQKQLSLERDESTALRRKNQLLRNDMLEEEHRHAALMLSNGQKHSDEDSGTGQRGRSKDVVRPEPEVLIHAEAPAAGAVRMSDAERDATLMSARSFYDNVFYSTIQRRRKEARRGEGARKGR